MMCMLGTQMSTEADREGDGSVRGLAVATVTDNKDPDGLARVRVRLSWQADGEQSYWAQLATPMAMANQGVYMLPAIGDSVLVGFERGDLTHPCVIGSLWNGQAPPPDDNDPEPNDHRLIRTRSDTELHFFDGDPPSVELKLADGKRLLMDDAGITLEDGNGNSLVIEASSGAVTITATGELALEGSTVKIQASGSMELTSSGTMTIQGAMVQIN